MSEARTIHLPLKEASYIDGLVAAGKYASADEAVLACIAVLQEQEEHVERWLVTDVLPVHDLMKAEPRRGIGVAEVHARLQARHAERVQRTKR